MFEDIVKDLVIIGAGPAGLAASIYASRAGLDYLVIEDMGAGGQVLSTYEVDNYPGFKALTGMELACKLKDHAEGLGCEIIADNVNEIKDLGTLKRLTCHDRVITCKTVIIATGAKHASLDVEGEMELAGSGVSYCATCDGAFYKDCIVAVAGGGNAAVEDAIYLARNCKKVYLIHRRDELSADASLQRAIMSLENVEIIWNSCITEILGKDEAEVTGIKLLNNQTNTKTELELEGIFVAIGTLPDSSLYKDLLATDEKGYIIANEDGKTNIPGIFCAGDVRTKSLRQIVTAVSDGANAVNSVIAYLK